MVAKKDDDSEKKVVQVKAKTGAWWKSTKTEVAEQSESAGEPAKKPKRAPRTVAKKPAAQLP
ncbi:MAG TPA: hypothetical protein DDY32_18100, partial [Desulfobulbaceae bacterium]|nr:hypothetical protein [Desulfobulbaceae bacterium]